MNTKVKAMCFFFLVLIQGCASLSQKIPLTDSDRMEAKKAPSIKLIHYYPIPMHMATPNDALVSSGKYKWVGGEDAGWYSEGGNYWDYLNEKYSFPEPIAVIKARFMESLKKQGGFGNLVDVKEGHFPYMVDGYAAPEEVVMDNYREKYGVGLVLEIRMNQYQLNYLPAQWSVYSLTNSVKGRLIRLSDGKILWQGFGGATGYKDKTLRYNMKKMDKKEANRLAAGIQSSSEQCADQLVSQFMGMNTAK